MHGDHKKTRRNWRISDKGAKCANLIIGGVIFFCVVTLLYFIYYYHWTHERYFTSSIGPILYYILPATLAGLLLVSLRLKPSYRINLSLSLVATGVSVYIAELLLAFSPSQLSSRVLDVASIARASRAVFDTRSIHDVVMDLEKQQINAVPSISKVQLLKQQRDGSLQSETTINGSEILPFGGIANTVTVLCNESGAYVIYESDEHGFHNPKGIWNAGRIDIAAVGDSFTHGYCVPSNKNFVALIRKHYPATLNLGGGGNGPLAELAILKEYVPSLKPKVVLWFYFEGNDLADLMQEKASPLLMAYLRNNNIQSLLYQQAAIDQALLTYIAPWRNANRSKAGGAHKDTERSASRLLAEVSAVTKLSHVRQRLGLVVSKSSQDDYNGEIDLALDLFGAILRQAKAVVDAWSGTLYFVYLPAWGRYANPESITKYSDRALYEARLRTRDWVLAFVSTLGFPVIDIHDVFRTQSDPLALWAFRQRFLHYTEEGHGLVAEEVLRALFREIGGGSRVPGVSCPACSSPTGAAYRALTAGP